jgi:hypothetical protein
LAQLYSGKNAFGDPFSAPPGYGGVSAFGSGTQSIDPLTGLPDTKTIAPPWDELLFQTLPLIPQIARGVGSRGRSPYDTARTLDILMGSKPKDELFWPDSGKPRPSEPINPYLQPFLSVAGANLRRRDPEAEARRARDQDKRFRDAERQTRKRKAKAKAKES